MKKLITVFLTVLAILPIITFAQPNVTESATFPIVNWTSKNTNDPVSIQNGAGTPILIQINVSGAQANANGHGVSVRNCGTTTHINAGSSTICETNDNKNPVTLTSDDNNIPVSGTYQIKTK